MSERALPLRMVVEEEVADRHGLGPVRRGMQTWNEVPGSRFAVEVVGVVDDRVRVNRRDGVSRIFLRDSACGDDRYLAHAHLYPEAIDVRSGVATAYVVEADVGICRGLDPTRLQRVLAHELGHIAGLGHLCDRDEECWRKGMSSVNSCRIMYKRATRCATAHPGDAEALVHLYPAVPRLGGPGLQTTAIEVSRWLHRGIRQAQVVVLADRTDGEETPLAAAALAGAGGYPLLLVGERCLGGAVGVELNRVAAPGATVLLTGRAAQECATTLYGWGLSVRRLADAAAVGSYAAGRSRSDVVYVAVREGEPAQVPTGTAAAAAAARAGAPLLFTGEDRLDRAVVRFLRHHPEINRAELVGPAAAAFSPAAWELRDHGLEVGVHGGEDPADVAAQLAVTASGDGPVLITGPAWEDGVGAAVLSGAEGWPVLVRSGGHVDEALAAAVARRGAAILTGGTGAVPTGLQIRLSRLVDRR